MTKNCTVSTAGGHGRILPETLDDVPPDHLFRYLFAAQLVQQYRLPADNITRVAPSEVVDVGCGSGYGTNLIAQALDAHGGPGTVRGYDLEPSAIFHATSHFAHPRAVFAVADAGVWTPPSCDLALAFEVLEHMDDPGSLLAALKASGARLLVASVPNEAEYPFEKTRPAGHVRHYYAQQFEHLLAVAGWRVTGRFGQRSKEDPVVRPGWVGRTLVAVAHPIRNG